MEVRLTAEKWSIKKKLNKIPIHKIQIQYSKDRDEAREKKATCSSNQRSDQVQLNRKYQHEMVHTSKRQNNKSSIVLASTWPLVDPRKQPITKVHIKRYVLKIYRHAKHKATATDNIFYFAHLEKGSGCLTP